MSLTNKHIASTGFPQKFHLNAKASNTWMKYITDEVIFHILSKRSKFVQKYNFSKFLVDFLSKAKIEPLTQKFYFANLKL